MKQVFVLALIIGFHCDLSAQDTSNRGLIGRWNLEKIVFAPQMYFDLTNTDSTRKDFMKYRKSSMFGGSWTLEDSAMTEEQFKRAIDGMQQIFVEFKVDKTYVTNSVNRIAGTVEGTESGNYLVNGDGDITLTKHNGDQLATDLKVIILNDTTLVVNGSQLGGRSSDITFRRAGKKD